MADNTRTQQAEVLGQDAAVLSICEVGLGSILHGLHIPLSGYFLSLNQIFLLARSVFKLRDAKAAMIISAITAVLKSLSPAGKKMTPMLAISAQGFLFSICNFILGTGVLGCVFGGAVASTWSFLQPLLIYYLIFGHNLITAIEYFLKKIQETWAVFSLTPTDLVMAGCVLILLKAALASSVVVLARFLPESQFQKFQDKLLQAARHGRNQKKERGRLGGMVSYLLQPLFLLSLGLTIAFFVFVEASFVEIFWAALRPIAVAILLFLIWRWLPFHRLEGSSNAFAVALARVRSFFK